MAQIRRGTEAQRAAMSAGDPAAGEVIYITDTKKTYMGDGSTAGGIELAAGGAGTLTHTKIIYIRTPVVTDEFPPFAVGPACTVTRITHITGAGTVDWNIEERAEATPLTSGTDIYASDEQSGTTNSVDTSFDNDSMAENSWFFFNISAVSGSPEKLHIKVTFTED